MIHATPTPSSLLKTLSTVARWSLGLTVTAWFLFGATWAALHWIIVPRIDELRPWLEQRASSEMGVPVHIGTITANSGGMIPSFELTDVQLLDAQGRAALRLPRVLVALSPASLWRLGFEQLYIDRPELDIRRDRQGKIFVAGLDFSKGGQADPGTADWFFSQTEFVIRGGTVQWSDELREAPPLALAAVDIVLRNRGRRHDMRIDATPPALWGDRFSVRGKFEQPLLSLHKGQWRDWKGQLYAELGRVDLSELRRYAPLGVDLHQGNGALTAWVDVVRGQLLGAVADVALGEVSVTLGKDLLALDLRQVRGRLGGKVLASGFEFSTQALQFETRDGLHWPGGNVSVSYLGAEGHVAARGELRADRLDLGALSQIANRLPFEPGVRAQLQAHAPKGLVESLQLNWQGPLESWSQYQAKGLISQLELDLTPSSPGVRGGRVEFDFNQTSGRASFGVANGSLSVPGVFDEPLIPVAQLSTEARWQINGEHIAVQLANLKFSNADAQGEAQIKWETSDPAKSGGRSRFPGVLDLQATLSRGDGTRVYRYLPSLIHRPVRDYVHDAIQAGAVSAARFRVRGDLHDMPFTDPKLGEFRISADVQNVSYAYVPRKLQPKDALPWPALTQLSGELVFDRAALQVKGGRARMGANANLQVGKIEALIPDLKHAVVAVNAEVRGPLGEALGIVNGSPLGEMTGRALGRAVGSASADYRFKLSLPIAAIEKSTVQGSVTLAGNEVQISPDSPRLTRSRGVVNFSDHDFSIVGGQATMLGGEVRIEGGSVSAAAAARNGLAVLIRANGVVSAEGLRQARELGFVARLAQHASGSTAYAAVLGIRRNEPELLVTSNLQGFGSSLPAPFGKSAESVLPLRLETVLLRESMLPGPSGALRLRDQLTLDIGRLASLAYVRDLSGPEPRVLRGSLGIGLTAQESVPMPDEGVAANISLSTADLDVWSTVLTQATGTSLADNPSNSVSSTYMPSTVALRARELALGGRRFSNVVVGASREGSLWRANLDASELNGYLEYRAPSATGAGRVYARLARLTIAANAASEVEALLNEQPASVPALDIAVEDFELRGKHLGRVEIEAVNRGTSTLTREAGTREWRLNKLNISTPDAVLTASGNWASLNAQPGSAATLTARNVVPRRRTVLNFKLDIADGGGLLNRFGMKDVVRRGRGKMEGQIAWLGSPFSLDYGSMSGAFAVNVESGQFLKAEPGISKLLGVLSLQSLPRRLTLDFRDVFSDGFAFDFLRGDVVIEQGIAKTNNLQMQGVNAAVLMDGKADFARETQDIKVVVVPEINAGTASLIASVINPAIGIGTFLAQLFLRRPLIEAATQEFHIDGSWSDPKITKINRKASAGGSTPEASGKTGEIAR